MLFEEKCKFCDKQFATTTNEQTEFLLRQHLISKHKDKVEIVEKEKKDDNKEKRTEKSLNIGINNSYLGV